MRRLIIALLTISLFVALPMMGTGGTSAHADYEHGCDPLNPECWVGGGEDPDPAPQPEPGPITDPVGSADECLYNGEPITCERAGGYWSNADQCYWLPVATEQDPPEGEKASEGGWYTCAPPMCFIGNGNYLDGCGDPQWLAAPPAGITISPYQAAAAVAARLSISPIEIGMAPRVNPEFGHRRTHVGVPVWMWVANPGPTTFDGYSVSDSEGGLSVTGSVKVSSLEWNMGDGSVIVCGTKGQSYEAGFGWAESPDCGHMYQQTSQSQAGDRYTISATSRWQFHWEAGGESGTIDLDAQSSESLEVNEMQTVNVSPNG